MYSVYGGNLLAAFPPAETPEAEFFVEAGINSPGAEYTEIRAFMNNRSGWPARLIKDLSEIFAAGLTVSDIKVSRNGSGVSTAEAALTQYSGNVYYTKVRFTGGTAIAPVSQSDYAQEVQMRISAPNSCQCRDPANDYSYKGITGTRQTTANITVYDGTKLIFGTEPDGTKSVVTPWTPPTANTTVISPPTPYIPAGTPTPAGTTPQPSGTALTPTGAVKRGDANGDGSVTIVDALMIAQCYVGLISCQ